MKILNDKEIRQFADCLAFTEDQARDVTDIFVRVYTEEQQGLPGFKILSKLDTVDDYIYEYEGHWHREENIVAHYNYEKNNCMDCYDDPSVFESVEAFSECSKDTVYKLEHSDMVIVVC